MSAIAEAVTDSGTWYGVVLAALNVVQTVALAYLAADRHRITTARKVGLRTRHEDPGP
jgi:uncharacterized protein (DUF1015 family)